MLFEKKKGMKIWIITGASILVVIGIVLSIVVLLNDGVPANAVLKPTGPITVSFNTAGGDPVESVMIDSGASLTKENYPIAFKNGFQFVGWYYDEECSAAYEGEALLLDITLHAKYIEPVVIDNSTGTLGFCAKDISFRISSTEELTDSNWQEYIVFNDFCNTEAELKISNEGDGLYKLYSEQECIEVGVYSVSLVDDKITRFMTAGDEDVSMEGINEYTFQIAIPNVNNIQKVDDIIIVKTDNLIDRAYNIHKYSDDEGIYLDKDVDTIIVAEKPDILMLGSVIALTNTADVVIQYYKVIDFTMDEKTGVVTLEVIEPIMSDIFNEFELSFNGGDNAVILLSDEVALINNIRNVIYNDTEFKDYATRLFENTKKTPTVQNLLKIVTEEARQEFLSLEFDINGITITPEFSIEETEVGGAEILFGITFSDMKLPIGSYAEVSLSINFTQETIITPSGNTILYNAENKYLGNQFVIDYLGKEGGEYTYQDTRMEKTSKTGFGFEVTVAFTGKKPVADNDDEQSASPNPSNAPNSSESDSPSLEFSVNESALAKDLVKELIEISSTDDYIDDVEESGMFTGDKLSYEDIAEIPLGSIIFNVGGVVDISIEIKAHLKIGAQATLAANFTVTNSTLTITRNAAMDIDTYNSTKKAYLAVVPIAKEADYENYNFKLMSKFEYDITLKGKVGVRMGLSISLGISPTGLSKVLYVGIRAEAGVYVELSGYVQIAGRVIENLDGVTKSFAIRGGIYLESGIYLDVSFVWRAFKWDGSVPIYNKTWPLFSMGSAEKIVDFVDDYNSVAFSGNKLNLFAENVKTLEYEGDEKNHVVTVAKVNLVSGLANRSTMLTQDKYRVVKLGKYVAKEYIKNGATYYSTEFVYPYAEYITIDTDGIITVDTVNCPDAMQFEVVIEVKDALSLISSEPMHKTVNCIYVKNEQDLKDFKLYEVSFFDQRGELIESQSVYKSFIPIEPSLIAWKQDPKNAVYEYDANAPKWCISKDGEPADLGPIYENTSYFLDANPIKVPINFYYYNYDENGKEYQDKITVDAYPLVTEAPYNGMAPYDGMVTPPNTENFPARTFRDLNGRLYYSYEFAYWQSYGSGYISDDSKIDFKKTPVITIGEYGIFAKQDIYAYYYSAPTVSRFGGIPYYFYKNNETDYVAPDFPANNFPDEYFSSLYWMGENENGEWIKLQPGDVYDPFSKQYCEIFYFCDQRQSNSVVYVDYYNKYVMSKIVKSGDETLMSVGPELSDVLIDGVNYRHTGWDVTDFDNASNEYMGYQRLCYPVYTKFTGEVETTIFETNGWDCKNNAPKEYKGVNFEIENDKYMIEVPGLVGADGKELEFLWKSTEMVNGFYQYCYPGEKIYYKNITYVPDITYEINISGTGEVYIYKGRYGETFDISKMKEDIPLLFSPSNNSPDGFAYEITDWVVPEGYKFGDTKDSSGYPVLTTWFALKTGAHIGESTVTFDVNGGNFGVELQTVFSGTNNTNIGFLSEPTKTNYIDDTGSEHRFTFYGWNADSNADTTQYGYKGSELKYGQETDQLGVILKDVTYYAIYSEKVFHPITYVSDGGIFADGTLINKVFYVEHGKELPHNQKPALVTAPKKADAVNTTYKFIGWTSSAGNSLAFAVDTLTAEYKETPINCTVTYKANGGTFSDGTTIKTTTVKYSEALPAFEEIEPGIANPTKIDANHIYSYEFSGWSRNNGMMSDLVYEDTILKAQYTESSVNYTVTFNAGAGSYSNVNLTGSGFSLSGTNINKTYHYNDFAYYPPDPNPADGQFFAGWSAAIQNKITSSVTYTAIYTGDTDSVKTITFNAAGGVFANGNQTIAFKGMTGENVSFMIKPTKAGAEFSNWNPAAAVFGVSNEEVMAVYSENIVKITFDSNGGSFSSNVIAGTGVVFEREGNDLYRNTFIGDGIAYPVDPTPPANMFFAGWDTTMFDIAVQNTTFKAVYVSDSSSVASVTFNAGINPYSTTPDDEYLTFSYGETKIIVKGIVGQPILFERIPTGYYDSSEFHIFNSWSPATGTPGLPANFVDGYEYIAQYMLE